MLRLLLVRLVKLRAEAILTYSLKTKLIAIDVAAIILCPQLLENKDISLTTNCLINLGNIVC